ncbi:20877_t:CDS:1, partial [Cetraspora pellucida]
PPLDLLSKSKENIESRIFVSIHCEEENQEDSLHKKTLFFNTSLRLVIKESYIKKTKKAEKKSKNMTEIKALLRKIKYLHEDINMILEQVKASNMRPKIYKN